MPLITPTELSHAALSDLTSAYERTDVIVSKSDKFFRLLCHVAWLNQQVAAAVQSAATWKADAIRLRNEKAELERAILEARREGRLP